MANIRPFCATALVTGALHRHTQYIRVNKQRQENMAQLLALGYKSEAQIRWHRVHITRQ